MPNNIICLLFKIYCGKPYLFTYKNKQVKALKELTRRIKLVIEQEKKYTQKLSLYNNFYYCHLIIQQFLQIQLKILLSQSRKNFFLTILYAFG